MARLAAPASVLSPSSSIQQGTPGSDDGFVSQGYVVDSDGDAGGEDGQDADVVPGGNGAGVRDGGVVRPGAWAPQGFEEDGDDDGDEAHLDDEGSFVDDNDDLDNELYRSDGPSQDADASANTGAGAGAAGRGDGDGGSSDGSRGRGVGGFVNGGLDGGVMEEGSVLSTADDGDEYTDDDFTAASHSHGHLERSRGSEAGTHGAGGASRAGASNSMVGAVAGAAAVARGAHGEADGNASELSEASGFELEESVDDVGASASAGADRDSGSGVSAAAGVGRPASVGLGAPMPRVPASHLPPLRGMGLRGLGGPRGPLDASLSPPGRVSRTVMRMRCVGGGQV